VAHRETGLLDSQHTPVQCADCPWAGALGSAGLWTQGTSHRDLSSKLQKTSNSLRMSWKISGTAEGLAWSSRKGIRSCEALRTQLGWEEGSEERDPGDFTCWRLPPSVLSPSCPFKWTQLNLFHPISPAWRIGHWSHPLLLFVPVVTRMVLASPP
jgi:hypothetical protein